LFFAVSKSAISSEFSGCLITVGLLFSASRPKTFGQTAEHVPQKIQFSFIFAI
jgi:hypothetical protein